MNVKQEFQYSIVDAFFLIGSKEIISVAEEKEIRLNQKSLAINKQKRDELKKKLEIEKDPIKKQKLIDKTNALRKLIIPLEHKIGQLDSWWNTTQVRESFYFRNEINAQ